MIADELATDGNSGKGLWLGVAKSKAEVRSPLTARCHGLMAGTAIPNRFSRNCPSEVWSNTCELTHPPRLHGEMTYKGTRGPRPQGRTVPLTWSSGCR